MVADVEIKPCPGRGAETGEVVARELAAFLQAFPHAASQFFVSSFSVEALRAAHSVAPQVPRSLLAERYDAGCDALLAELVCNTFATDHATLNPNLVAHLHARGYWVMAYTINDVSRAREVLGWGVDAIFTDALTDMAAAFPTAHR
jgi:glycerophosphoryl diester phosphodiesterase